MKILNKDIKLAILDLDGTLIDSTGIWTSIDEAFFTKRNMPIPLDYSKKIAHLGLVETARFTIKEYSLNEKEEDIIKEWQDMALSEYINKIPLKKGVKKFLIYLKKNNVKMALATANDKQMYLPCLKRLNILSYFDLIIDVNTLKVGKDNPYLYNYVADYFKVLPSETLVFEDIAIGLKTSFENGFISIAVSDKQSRNQRKDKLKYSYKYVYRLSDMIEE